MGKAPQNGAVNSNLAISVTSLFIKEAEISDLWKLDLVGIHEPTEKKTKEQLHCHYLDAKALNRRLCFLQNLRQRFRKRFRQEYLGMLVHRVRQKGSFREVKVGEVVIVGSDNT
jgi:hypothetical protein